MLFRSVAVSVARALGLNVALTEAIALGHDCGHGPGGHASEDALSPYVDGGFDHATWGADVTLTSLNLCTQTLDGIRNHSWSRPAPGTPEGEVVSWADRIAYVCHDFEDAVDARVVSPNDLPVAVRERCGVTRAGQISAFVNGMLDAARSTGRVAMTTELAEALGAFRQFNYEAVYLRPESQAQAAAVIVYGAAREEFAALLAEAAYTGQVASVEGLDQAVPLAAQLAQSTASRAVLLSPACASFDQYRDFEQRGDHFRSLVLDLPD